MKKLVNYLPFVALFILPLLFYPVVNSSGWRSSSDVHALLEFSASLLAVTAGIMVLLHFFTTGRLFFLIISIGFVQIGTEEFIHALFSFSRIWPETLPTFKFAISSTWLAGQFLLVTSFFIALIFGKREIVPSKRKLNAVAYNIIGLICAASVTLLIFNSPFLSDFVQVGSITKKLVELSLAFLFFTAFLFYSNIYLKQQSHSPLLWSIIACIIFRVLAHIFVFDAQAFYDSHWDTAHLIVFLSYLFPIFGVWGETIKLHKSAQMQVIELGKEMTERKRTEEALLLSEEKFRSITEQTTDLIALTDINGLITYVSSASRAIFHFEPEEMCGRFFMEFLHEPDVPKAITAFRNALELGETTKELELTMKQKDGSLFIGELNGSFFQSSTQNGTLVIIHDITNRKRVEEALKESEERFRSLIENAFDGIYLTNGKYFYYVNSKFCEIVGYNEQELTSPDFNFDITLTKESRKIVHERARLRKLGKKIANTYEFQLKTKDGSYKIVEVSTVNLGFGDDLNVMGIVRDITDRKKMESQLIQSERMSALGEMSAGMAHEINQPLNTLSISFDNILLEAKTNHSVSEEYLVSKSDKIFNSILRIKNLIEHVRDFSRSQEGYILTSFNINESILNALPMVSEQCKIAGIDLITGFEENLPLIRGNTYKFEQVILNLVINSKDALLEKKSRLNKAYPMFIKIRTQFNNQHICIEVEDNGIGIKAEHIDKILQPFYTTKETGKGTGLGLSISYGLIKEMNGKIDIRSKVLKGTTISITLPVKPEKN